MDDDLCTPYWTRLAGMVDDLNTILDANCASSTIARVLVTVECDTQQLIAVVPVAELAYMHRRFIQAWVAIKTILQHTTTGAPEWATSTLIQERSDAINLALAEVDRLLTYIEVSTRWSMC